MTEQLTTQERVEIPGPDGLVLKQYIPEDGQRFFDLIQADPEHLREFTPELLKNYKSADDARNSIEDPKNANKLRLGIWISDTMIGSINLTPVKDKDDETEIGYWVGGEHVGHGYAASATRLLTDYAINKMSMNRVIATVNAANTPSVKTLENCGYKFVGLEDESDPNTWLYEIKKDKDINGPSS